MKKLAMKTKPKNLTLSEMWKLYIIGGDNALPTPELVGGILSSCYSNLGGTRQVKHALVRKVLSEYDGFVLVVRSMFNGN
jgi:hypothetical protein